MDLFQSVGRRIQRANFEKFCWKKNPNTNFEDQRRLTEAGPDTTCTVRHRTVLQWRCSLEMLKGE